MNAASQVKYKTEPYTPSAYKCVGTYPEQWTDQYAKEVIEKRVSATFGGSFLKIGGGKFVYIGHSN